MIDDYHFITESVVHDVIGYFIDYIPANLHLLIATHIDPPLRYPACARADTCPKMALLTFASHWTSPLRYVD